MARSYSKVVVPHRDLFISDDPQQGDDIRALFAAADRRLDARNVHRDFPTKGVLSDRDAFASLITAGRLLGAREDTLAKHDSKGRPVLTLGVQQMIRFPGRRTLEQLDRAEERLASLIADREAKAKAQARRDDGGVSDLSAAQRVDARKRSVNAMRLLLAHAPAVHYTQGPRRWDGIAQHRNPGLGQFANYYDCSSSVTWAERYGLIGASGRQDFPDILNGSQWHGGFTGTLLAHGRPVSLDALLPADLIFYGRPGSTGEHVAMVDLDRVSVISQGSEAGPFDLKILYRGDFMGARRYI